MDALPLAPLSVASLSLAALQLAALPLAQALLRCRSETADRAGNRAAQDVLAAALAPAGFVATWLPFGDTPNLFLRRGEGGPHLCFAGHTDVVPASGVWQHDPYSGTVDGGLLFGRGACDMKGAIAAFAAAAAGPTPGWGSVSLLITGDEEGPATDGTTRVLDWLAAHNQVPDACLVGEPTNPGTIGEVIKIGRRGSLNATVTVRGKAGHVAYPHRADNPVHRLLRGLSALTAAPLDAGSEWFEPSSLQVTSIDVGNAATNVIPGAASARLNIRFNDRHTGAALTQWLHAALAPHAPDMTIDVVVSGESFLTTPGPFTALLSGAVQRVTGTIPRLDTGGGTSDARFVARYCPVAEFGLVGATMHQVDECVPVADLQRLTEIYAAVLA